jgi:hypothetical protein
VLLAGHCQEGHKKLQSPARTWKRVHAGRCHAGRSLRISAAIPPRPLYASWACAQKLRKASINIVMTVRIELGSKCTDFHEILCLRIV